MSDPSERTVAFDRSRPQAVERARGGTELDIVRLAIKQRHEAIAFARQYRREDVAQQEERELAILMSYMQSSSAQKT